MTEEEIIKKLEEKSGLIFSKDFGFIIGTMSPYIGGAKGMVSANNSYGYEIWKKVGNENHKLHLHWPIEFVLEFVVDFLVMEKEEFNELLNSRGFFVIQAE